MPIRPTAHTYKCSACHWSKTVAPRSDALLPDEHFIACPACGKEPLEVSTTSPGALMARFIQILSGRR